MATEAKISNNQCDHKSVGMLVFKDAEKQEPKLLLIQRKEFPFGFAPPAGHIDEAGTYQAAAKAFSGLGIPSYPRPNAESITITSPDGDTFSFLGGSQLTISPSEAQLGFFHEIKRTHDIPMVNNFIYAAIEDGYLGRTSSIEVAYAMATNKRIIFSEAPSRFSQELPSEIISIIKANHGRYPHLPVDGILPNLPEALQHKIDKPDFDDRQRRIIFSSILELIRDLHKKFS